MSSPYLTGEPEALLARSGAQPFAMVVICTKNRPDEVSMSCSAVHRCAPDTPILVLDASTNDACREVCEGLRRASPPLPLDYRRARQPGLARQRNEAVEICRELGATVVHFIDDDTEVEAGYFQAIEKRLRDEPEVMGVGGAVVNQPLVNFVGLKRLFLLGSSRRGAVLRSGRNILGQYPDSDPAEAVDWLVGCSMSFRLRAFDECSFDQELEGYSMGEDYDFTYRLSRRFRLVVEPSARCVHHFSPTMRGSPRTQARLSTEATHRWVHRHRSLGMSPLAFWWSAFGDFALHLAHGLVTRRSEPLQAAAGVLDGVAGIARRATLG